MAPGVTGHASDPGVRLRLPELAILAASLLLTTLVAHHAAGAKPPLCRSGGFAVSGHPLLGPGGELVVLESKTVTIGTVCATNRARVQRTKRGTRVAVRFKKNACQGITGRVRLNALITAECTQMAGTLEVKGISTDFTAAASACVTIDPSGGTYAFPGGLVLEVPAGAVTGPVPVLLTPIDCEPIDPILNSRAISERKGCLAAFSAKPSGLAFDLPVLAALPLPSPAPGTFPILTEVDRLTGTYRVLPTQIEYDGDGGIAQVQLTGFSDKVVTSLSLSPDEEFGPEWARAGEEIDGRCGSCAVQLADAGANLPFCENLDAYQDSCCLIPPGNRGPCAPACNCCKEKTSRYVISSVSASSERCELLGDDVEITYPDCPGAPTYKHSITETSDECPEGLAWEISIAPDPVDLLACRTQPLTATILGRSSDDSVAIAPLELPARWRSADPTVAEFIDHKGTLRARSAGSTIVEARTSNDPAAPKGQAVVNVRSNLDSFVIDPDRLAMTTGESRLLEAKIRRRPAHRRSTRTTSPGRPTMTSWNSAARMWAPTSKSASAATCRPRSTAHRSC